MPEWKPGRSSRRTVSPCGPTWTGRRLPGRLAAYSRQFSFNSQARNPNTPGMHVETNVTTVSASPFSMPVVATSCPATMGIIGTSSLCDTVTTGKCLIGLSCGSMRSVTQNRTPASTTDQAAASTDFTARAARDSPERKRSCSSTAYSVPSTASTARRKRSMIQATSPVRMWMWNWCTARPIPSTIRSWARRPTRELSRAVTTANRTGGTQGVLREIAPPWCGRQSQTAALTTSGLARWRRNQVTGRLDSTAATAGSRSSRAGIAMTSS